MNIREAKKYIAAHENDAPAVFDRAKWNEAIAAHVNAGICVNCGGKLAPWKYGSYETYSGRECYQCEEFYPCGDQPEYAEGADFEISDADPGL